LLEPLTNSYNKNEIGHHWAHKLAKVLNHCMKVSNLNKENFLNLEFKKMIKDPILEMEEVYNFLDEDFNDQAENAMNAWKEENQHEMGAHQYSLEEFGLESSFIDSYFSEYINQYIR
jgi:hypothetical protein